MQSRKNKHTILTYLIAAVWFANGFLCKVLNFVPRHEQIVSRILGSDNSRLSTILIGLSEIFMAIWIISGFKSRINAIVQITVIALMNIIEFILARDLLLFGKMNSVFALLLILVIYYNEFHLNKIMNEQS